MPFEVRYTDLAGRIGKLKTPHGNLETPAFIPVIHPIRQTITPHFLKSLGFNAVITNAYITLRHYGDEARKRGIHDIIKYDGVIMTDSGGYQVLEYGSIDVEPTVMAIFENDIRSDIPVPLDKPTGYGLKYEKAKDYVEQTLENARETLNAIQGRKSKEIKNNIGNEYYKDDTNGAIWVGPIQGAEHSDLVKYSADALDKMGFNLMAIGSPVELMEAYEFSTLAHMIAIVKRAIPAKPIHLFGAGHPITIPLAVALGCDMFDSASYILYAKDNRYMHSNGTTRLEDLSYLPCQCPICTTYSIKELFYMDRDSRTLEVAKHNLYILKAEVDAVKQAIMDGRLWEYVMQKARAHPKLMEAIELLKTFEYIEEGTPIFKEKAVFFYDPIDQYRPEAKRFRNIVSKFVSLKNKKKLVLYPDSDIHPFYSTRVFLQLAKKFPDSQICTYNPFLGIIPSEISDIFPAAHNLSCKKSANHNNPKNYPSFIESLDLFIVNNNFEEIIIVADTFMRQIVHDDHHYDNIPLIKKLNPKVFDYDHDIVTKL
ncbi:MAG TPA: tRNA guanosine(15) transglycosylase TgtA [Nitrososphaeraceae archaeon]|nr:tRNA guanosine(15) transglycosylase TgtA [Nitrososphaeraceae archaeon]